MTDKQPPAFSGWLTTQPKEPRLDWSDMDNTVSDERKAFETWALGNESPFCSVATYKDGTYKNTELALAWAVWQARALLALKAEQPAAQGDAQKFNVTVIDNKHPHGIPLSDWVSKKPEQPAAQGEPVAYEYGNDIFWQNSPDINDYIRANGKALVYAATHAAPAAQVPDIEALTELVASMLSSTYHCNRVWGAWSIGAMGEADFSPVAESDTPREIAEAVCALLSASPKPPEPKQADALWESHRAAQVSAVMPLIGPLLDAWENADREVMRQEPELSRQLAAINRAMEDAESSPTPQAQAVEPEQGESATFQQRVHPWLMACFGPMIAGDREERNHRFLEEALELVQACGCTASEAHQLVDYTFGRPIGEPMQEVGGVMVTLAALCLANDLDMHESGETELARIWTKVEAIRAKQAAKPKHSPLPETPAHSPPEPPAQAVEQAAPFKRETRYFVLKISDMAKHLSVTDGFNLQQMARTVDSGRQADGKPPLECVVVESDWPEYEPTWAAIERRVAQAEKGGAL